MFVEQGIEVLQQNGKNSFIFPGKLKKAKNAGNVKILMDFRRFLCLRGNNKAGLNINIKSEPIKQKTEGIYK